MTFTIYGLRLRGDKEVRYIGQTQDTDQRLAGHLAKAGDRPWQTKLCKWLHENRDCVEIVELGTAATRDEARKSERAAVAFCLALDHRLFNQWLVPAHRRIPTREGSYETGWKAAA